MFQAQVSEHSRLVLTNGRIVKAFDIAKFVWMNKIKGRGADEFVRFIAEELADGLCEKDPAGLLCKVDDADERDTGRGGVHGRV